MEFKVFHPGIELWKDVTNNDDVTKSPYHGSCAKDIDWINRVKLQAVAQRHIDHSISSTINLPEDVSEEEVAKIYLTAWKSGCKGITVYRQNSRSGVLVNKKENIIKTTPHKRPSSMPCDVHHISVKNQPYFVLVGLYKNDPYEVFAGKNGVIDKKVKKGRIVKKNRNQYKAIFDDESELSPIKAFCEPEEEVVTRLISVSLRHGTDISFLVHQLEKTHGDLHSFSKSIIRALKKYVPNGTTVYGEECPECNSKLFREEGCLHCKSCGWGRC
jgi:ribonucleoside-diphosphate reductase alpha chain